MTTTTNGVACPAGEWTEIYDGAAAASFQAQVPPPPFGPWGQVAVAVAAAAPATDLSSFDDYVVVQQDGNRLMQIDLAAGEKVYGMGLQGDGKLRTIVNVAAA